MERFPTTQTADWKSCVQSIHKNWSARGPSLGQHGTPVRSKPFIATMAPSACLLLSFVACLHFVHGSSSNPQSIDQVLKKSSEEVNPMNGDLWNEDEITDGLDIQLTRGQYARLFGEARGRSFYDGITIPWTGGVIPYKIMPGNFDAFQVKKIEEAMKTWQDLTCVTFRPATTNDLSQVHIENTNKGCLSSLGMVYRQPQKMSLKYNCFNTGTVEHEFGHAIGLIHEHQRPERDDYLQVNMQMVDELYTDQLRKYTNIVNKMGLPYDYYSVMHYGETAFSKDDHSQTLYAYNKLTGAPLPEVTKNLGKTLGPSFYDVKLVNLMYNCSAHCSPMPPCGSDCFVDKHCQCICQDNLPPVPCQDLKDDCEAVKQSTNCYYHTFVNASDYVCKKTCGWCPKGNSRLSPAKPYLPDLPCNDKRDMCPTWADEELCTTKYLLETCTKSCCMCTGPNEPCTLKPAPSKTTSPRSTARPNRTTPPGTTTPPRRITPQREDASCKDNHENCQQWKDMGNCELGLALMRELCSKTCGFCNGPNRPETTTRAIPRPTPPREEEPCRDYFDECTHWSRDGGCNERPDYMRKVCSKSCSHC